MSSPVDHYRVLGVSPDSEQVVIDAAYEALLCRYEAEEQTDETVKRIHDIKIAHSFLADPVIRRNYDASRAKAATTKPNVPPPGQTTKTVKPASEKSTVASDIAYRPDEGVNKGCAAVLGVIALIFIIAQCSANSDSGSAENTMNVDEVLTTENVVATDAVDNTLDPADSNLVEAAGNLADTPAPSVEYESIESAGKRFASILFEKGISAAREYSTSCHASVVSNPSWSAADRCAAFDYAAQYVEQQMARESQWQPSSYFQFQAANQEENYVAAGAARYSVAARLSSIRTAVQPAVSEAMRAAILRNQAQEADSAPTNASPEASNSSADVNNEVANYQGE